MKKLFTLIAFFSVILFSCGSSITIDTPKPINENCEIDTLSFQQDFEIRENENLPLLSLGFMGGLAPIIGGLIAGGGSSPQPPVYPPPAPPAPAPPQNNSNSDGKDGGMTSMIIILVLAILGFFGFKKL